MSPRFHPFTRLLLFTVVWLCAACLVIVSVLAALATSAHMLHRSAIGEAQGFFQNETNQLVVNLLTYPFTLLCLMGCRRLLDRRSFVSLGLRPNRWRPEFGLGILCGALANTFLFGLLLLTGAVAIQGYSPEAFEVGAFASCITLALFAANFLCVGFMEELTFRGYGLHNLNAWLGWRWAIITQALIFAVIHPLNELPNGKTLGAIYWDARWAMVNIGLIGVFFALSYRKTGSLWFPIGFHTAWNFFLGCIWSLPVSGIRTFHLLDTVTSTNDTLTGGTFGAEGSVFLTAITAVLIFLLRLVPDHPQATLDLSLLTVPGAVETSTPDSEEEVTGPSRFKTSMRPISDKPKLDPQIFQPPPPTTFTPLLSDPAPSDANEAALRINVEEGAFTSVASAAVSATATALSPATDIGPAIAAKTAGAGNSGRTEGEAAGHSNPVSPAASPTATPTAPTPPATANPATATSATANPAPVSPAPEPQSTAPVSATENVPPPRPKKAPRW